MLDNPEFDFSKESALKEKLLEKLKKEYRKIMSQKAVPLGDDQLELVAAAGAPDGGQQSA